MSAAAFPVQRCINLGNGLDAPREGDWGYRIERNHLREIARAGFDTVRLPVRFSAHFKNGRISNRFLNRVDEVIGWARRENLRVILDLHHYEAIMRAPDDHEDGFVAIWKQLAERYEGASENLIFELLNEPHGALTTRKAIDLYAKVIPVIRERHPNRWIIIGGGDWNSHRQMSRLPAFDNRIVHTFHFYEPWTFTHQKAPWADPTPPASNWGTKRDYSNAARALYRGLKHKKAPVFLGEFGVFDAAPESDAFEWLTFVRKASEEMGVGWCAWSFSSAFRTYDTRKKRWIGARLKALIPDR